MSQLNKKGKFLSTKRKPNKLSSIGKIGNQHNVTNNTSLFDSFVSVRQQKDVSLRSEHSSSSLPAQENETDFFKFPDKTKKSPDKRTTSLDKKTPLSPRKNIFDEETKIEISIIDSHSESKSKEQYTPDESSLFFESDSSLALKNNSGTTRENEEKDTSLDNIPIPEISETKDPITYNVTAVNLPEEPVETENDINHCPVCLKTISSSKYLSHIKSCAAKNNLSTQQLLSALRLHKKQTAERRELGLGIPAPSFKARVSPKRTRTNERKGGTDSSLQLALALSASLQAAAEAEVIQEAEALQAAGLGEEAERRLGTLETFGFASALPAQPRSMPGGSKSRPQPPSLLLRRTQEERERIVTEKVAIILISEEDNVNPASYPQRDPVLRSKALKNKWDSECQLWTKSQCPEDEKRDAFYVKSLSEFVSPSKCEVGVGLRRLSQLPGRLNTPTKDDISEVATPFKSTEVVSDAKWGPRIFIKINYRRKAGLPEWTGFMVEDDIYDLPTPRRSDFVNRETKFNSVTHKNLKSISTLSDDWEKLVNNDELSDISIQCEQGVIIPAHKLVFHVRCPKILNEVVKEEIRKDAIKWESTSVNSVLAFLEFVYSGKTDKILMLNGNDFISIKTIAERLDYTELRAFLIGFKELSSESKKLDVKKNLFETVNRKNISHGKGECLDNHKSDNNSFFSENLSSNIGKKILSISPSSLNRENICSGRESPDMFGDSCLSVSETQSQLERDDLDILVSMMGKPTQYKVGSSTKHNSQENSESMVIDSPAGSSNNEIVRKRKASIVSLDEDEDNSVSKKHCSNLSTSDFNNKEETFDLTQSSNSSYEDWYGKDNEVGSLDKPEKRVSGASEEEVKFDLTLSSNSSSGEACKNGERKPEESDGDDSIVELTQKHCDDYFSKNITVSQNVNKEVIDPVNHNEFDKEDCIYTGDLAKKSPVTPVKDRSVATISTHTTPLPSQSEMVNSTKGSSGKSCNRISQSHQFSHTLANTSGREKHDDVLLEGDNFQDYIDPVWEGFDDYYQFNHTNNTSMKTPVKYEIDKSLNRSLQSLSSLEKFKSKQSSVSPKNCVTDVSSSEKSPRKLTQTILSPLNKSPKSIKSISSDSKSPKPLSQKGLTPSSSPSIKYVSSSSKSPKHFSQKSLHDFSPITKYNSRKTHHDLSVIDSDTETIPRISPIQLQSPQKVDFTKTRKNLNLQFDVGPNSSLNSCSENREETTQHNDTARLSQKCQNSPLKSTLRKDSLAAMQRLLDDSFEVSESLFDTADTLALGNDKEESEKQTKRPSGQDNGVEGNSRRKQTSSEQDGAVAGSSKSKTTLDTPSSGIIVSDKVTPLPDYSGMKTPSLKKELSRFGLKPSLGRRKAKLLLRYIYDQTHPVVPDTDGRTEKFKQPEGRPPRSPAKSPRKTQSDVPSCRQEKPSNSPEKAATVVNLDESGLESDDYCSQMSASSSISSAASLPEESYHEVEDILTQDLSDSGDVHSSIRSLITGDPELHRKVLMYEPIYLEDLMAMLKVKGIKSKVNCVMDYLDEQCITFRTNAWKATNEKRRQKQKSPKKKLKSQSTESLGKLPTKVLTQVPKKRGRPKKTDHQHI